MSNIDKAAKVIDRWTQEGYELNSAVGSPHAIAERLADAGLLAPDTDYPATLTTEADFTHAPVGTIVTHKCRVAIKRGEDEWDVTGDDMGRRNDTVGDLDEEDPYIVLRWGKGEEKQ